MRINMKTVITAYSGEPILQDPANKNSELRLGTMVIKAFNTHSDKEKDLAAEIKIHRAMVSQEIYKAMHEDGHTGNVDLIPEDVATLMTLLNDLYAPLALFRAYEILDPTPVDTTSVVADADA